MKLIKNKYMPFKGFKAIMLFGILFYKGRDPNQTTLNHEYIHYKQFQEITTALAVPLIFLAAIVNWWILILVPIIYYVLYLIEYLIKLVIYRNNIIAYKNISFEREAYAYQHLNYKDCNNVRVSFRWLKYIYKK